jgi:hypothetical protein
MVAPAFCFYAFLPLLTPALGIILRGNTRSQQKQDYEKYLFQKGRLNSKIRRVKALCKACWINLSKVRIKTELLPVTE